MDPTPFLGGLLAASAAYSGAAIRGIRAFRRRPRPGQPTTPNRPGFSVLKPAIGAGPEFAELLRSHAEQDYPDFEILVGVSEADDAARIAVSRLREELPELRIATVECPAPPPGHNGKVTALERLGARASKPVWILSDADIRVPEGFLSTVADDLARPGAGMVTCLYRAETGAHFLSRLEGLRIDTEFPAQVLLARWLQGVRFGLGATVAFRKETLRGIGGFEAVRRHIGDDYQLGKHIASRGTEVQISAATVTTVLSPGGGWRSVWRRHLRWSRTIRMQRPLGHAGLFVSFGAFWALAALVLSPKALWPLAIPAFALKLAAAARSSAQVASTERRKQLWLLPVSDLCALAVWLWSYFGRTVDWAGRRIHLGRDGLIRDACERPSRGRN